MFFRIFLHFYWCLELIIIETDLSIFGTILILIIRLDKEGRHETGAVLRQQRGVFLPAKQRSIVIDILDPDQDLDWVSVATTHFVSGLHGQVVEIGHFAVEGGLGEVGGQGDYAFRLKNHDVRFKFQFNFIDKG